MDGGIVSTSSLPLFQIAIYLTEEELMGWLIEQRKMDVVGKCIPYLEMQHKVFKAIIGNYR